MVDVVQVLTQQTDSLTARKYWNQLKRRLALEGSQLVTSCHQLKMTATDGKLRLTDVATAQTLLRLVQSLPSPKAELIFTALAELSTRQIAETTQATGMPENALAAKEGGGIAKQARKQLESKTDKSVLSKQNYLAPTLPSKLKTAQKK